MSGDGGCMWGEKGKVWLCERLVVMVVVKVSERRCLWPL